MLKRNTLIHLVFACVLNGSVRLEAVTLYMTAADGTRELDLVDTSEMQIRLDTVAVDSIRVAFVNAFLDTTSDIDDIAAVDVVAVTAGNVAPWIYDRSSFVPMPTELDDPLGDEYGLVLGDPTPETGGYPLGSAIYVHDSLLLQNTTGASEGTINVTFELGARTPQVFGPAPDFRPLLPCSSFCGGFPNWLFIGDSQGINTPLVINLIPEPVGAISVSAGTALLLSARPKRRQDGSLR